MKFVVDYFILALVFTALLIVIFIVQSRTRINDSQSQDVTVPSPINPSTSTPNTAITNPNPVLTYVPPSSLKDGMAYKCNNATDGKVYRYDNGKMRWYTNPTIANSWDPNGEWWGNVQSVDCTNLAFGPDMAINLNQGWAYTCQNNIPDAAVYRFDSGKLRPYPDPATADKWDHNWNRWSQPVDCTKYTIGSPMTMDG